jgi:hypothetical protein
MRWHDMSQEAHMIPTRIQTKIHQDGDDFVVEIPSVAMKLFGFHVGDEITFTPEKTGSTLDKDPELRAVTDQIIEESRDAFEFLARYDAIGERRRPT